MTYVPPPEHSVDGGAAKAGVCQSGALHALVSPALACDTSGPVRLHSPGAPRRPAVRPASDSADIRGETYI
jgi:hypothetical protein